jgi:hypothetical protein
MIDAWLCTDCGAVCELEGWPENGHHIRAGKKTAEELSNYTTIHKGTCVRVKAIEPDTTTDAWQLESGKLLTADEMGRTRDFGAVWGLVETQRPKRVLVAPYREEER